MFIKSVILPFLLLACSFLNAANTHVFYLDLQGVDNYSEYESHVNKQIRNIPDSDNFLLFISDGQRPLATNNRNDLAQIFSDLRNRPRIFSVMEDLDTLNALLSHYGMLSGIDKPPEVRQNQMKVHFYFYTDKLDQPMGMNSLDYRFANDLLLTNRLTNKQGKIMKNVNVTVFYRCSESEECQTELKKHQKQYESYEILSF